MNRISLKEESWNRLGIASNSIAVGWSLTKKVVPNIEASSFEISISCPFVSTKRVMFLHHRPSLINMLMMMWYWQFNFDVQWIYYRYIKINCPPAHRTPGCTVGRQLSPCAVVLGLRNQLEQSCKRLSWSTPHPTVNWRWTSELWRCGTPVLYVIKFFSNGNFQIFPVPFFISQTRMSLCIPLPLSV